MPTAAPVIITNSRVTIGTLDLQNCTGTMDFAATGNMVDCTNTGSGGFRECLPGIPSFQSMITGNADLSAGAFAAVFPPSTIGSQVGLSVCPAGGAAAGDPATFTRGKLSKLHQATGGIGTLAKFDVTVDSDTAEVNGFVAVPSASQGALTGTGVQMGAVLTGQSVYGLLHVTGAVGTNLAVTIESAATGDAPFASPTTRLTFTTVSAVTWQLLSLAGPITDTRWRAKATVGSSTFTYEVLFGIA